MLRILAGPVRQLADLRSSPSRAALTTASDCQHHLEQETAQLPDHSDARAGGQRWREFVTPSGRNSLPAGSADYPGGVIWLTWLAGLADAPYTCPDGACPGAEV
jgi:hypothetical protein